MAGAPSLFGGAPASTPAPGGLFGGGNASGVVAPAFFQPPVPTTAGGDGTPYARQTLKLLTL
jgi:hypothetical protein